MQKVIDPTISTWPQENPQLIGSSCGACSATVFPVQSHCPRCSRAQMSDVLLPRRGTVIAWTTQGFAPGEVELTFLPFATDSDGNEIVTFAFQPV